MCHSLFYLNGRHFSLTIVSALLTGLLISPASSQPSNQTENFDLPPEFINNSPVLQKWLKNTPNVLEDINNDPSFRTRIRVGYAEFPSTNHQGGINVGVEDIFIGKTGLTLRGDYQTSFSDRQAGGVDLQYYILPLGNYVNVAPTVGYRSITTDNYSTDGVNLGAKLMLSLSRTGAADIALSQSFISPGGNDEVGVTTLSVGYAITPNLRLATEIQKQNSRVQKDSEVSILLEWMP